MGNETSTEDSSSMKRECIKTFENAHDGTSKPSLFLTFLGSIYSLALTSDNMHLLSGAKDGKIKKWDLLGRRLLSSSDSAHGG